MPTPSNTPGTPTASASTKFGSDAAPHPPVVLVTGIPQSFLSRRLLTALLTQHASIDVRTVVRESDRERARTFLSELPTEQRKRVRLLEGSETSMDLGLSGAEFAALAEEVTCIHHAGLVRHPGTPKDQAERANIDSTREVIELAEQAPHLDKFVHWSTTLVSGAQRGVVREDELSASAGFRSPVEESLFRAERLVREELASEKRVILRPSIIVGDSRSGEIDRLQGPYLLVTLMLNSPSELRMPMPGRGDTPLNFVPIDFVVQAGLDIAADARSAGRTFHLIDPNARTARRVFELIAEATGKPLPRGFVPTNVATTLLRIPGLDRFSDVPRTFLEQLATNVTFDDREARELLDECGTRCPTFDSYVDIMVDYVREQRAQRRARHVETQLGDTDPLS